MILKLTIGNKAYSSWSMRPWLVLAHFKIPFEEHVVPLATEVSAAALAKASPTGRLPVLREGKTVVWETLAIIEHLAEAHPKKRIWPKRREARTMARALSAEMHAGFQALRSQCPMNMRRTPARLELSPEATADVARIEQAFAVARETYGKKGPFLFGRFSAADAMFAPVVNRLHVYDVPTSPLTRAYCDAVMALPAWRAWESDARDEPWTIEKYENI